MSSNPFIVATERRAMYAKRNQTAAMAPYQMGHSPMAPMMAPQQGQFNGFGTNRAGFGRRDGAADRMIVLLSDVVDLRSDTSIPLNVDEEAFVLTLAFPGQLCDDDLASRLKKHQVFSAMHATSGGVREDHAEAYRICTSFGLNM